MLRTQSRQAPHRGDVLDRNGRHPKPARDAVITEARSGMH